VIDDPRPGWRSFWFEPTSTSTLALFRIALGLLLVAWTLSLGPDLGAFFTNHGLHAPPNSHGWLWNLFEPFGEGAAVYVVWGLLLVASVCVTLGLFTRVAAVVHHGGAGTTTFAALAGTPQVVIPHVYDQSYWARRIQELGAGVAHPSTTPTVESLTSALGDVLRPAVAARARSVAGSLRTDGALVAARRLIAEALHHENS
jgi:hypothetical protein